MRNNYDVSVIVPVYHTDPAFLHQCLESIAKQFSDELTGEIITVCDGPQDASVMSVLHSFPVRVIETQHQGVSHARNVGIKASTGAYLFFVDSDDWLEEGSIQALYRYTRQNACDLTLADRVSVMGTRRERHEYAQHDFVLTQDASSRLSTDILHPQTSAGLITPRLFSRKILADIRFDEDIAMGEDSEFMLRLSRKVQSLGYLHQALYFYRRNTTSTVMQFRSDYVHRILLSMERVHEALSQLKANDNYQREFNSYVAYHLTLILVNYICNPNNNWSLIRKRRELKAVLSIRLFEEALRDMNYSSFSLTRKITVKCLRLRMLWMCLFIGQIRQQQTHRK